MRFKLAALVGKETVMRTNSFFAEHAMRITVLLACHPATVAEAAVHPAGDAVQRVELTYTKVNPPPSPAMEPILAFDEK
jgi:hypothetical protein